MTNENGTPNPEQTLNDMPADADSLFSAISAAMAAGDDDEIKRLMTTQVEPNKDDAPQATPAAATSVTVEEPEGSTQEASIPDPDATGTGDGGDVNAGAATAPSAEMQALLRELNNVKASVGKVAHLQSTLAKLQKAFDEQTALLASIPKPPSKLEEKLNSLKEIDPDMADTLAALREEFAVAAPTPQKDDVVDEAVASELERVRRVHPDVDYVLVGGSARPAWEQWKKGLTPDALAYAESAHAEEMILALSAFKAEMSARTQAPQPAQAVANDDANKALVEERKRKLEAATNTKPTVMKTTGSDTVVDADAMVAKYMKEVQARDHLIR